MTSVCPGCACEEACGHAEVHACANRVPARWCSCDQLRRAEAERGRYRRIALSQTCLKRIAVSSNIEIVCGGCERPRGEYCDAVLREVDGE